MKKYHIAIIITLVVIFIIGIIFLIGKNELNISDIIKRIGLVNENSTESINVKYQIYNFADDSGNMLVTFNNNNGEIKEVVLDNGNIIKSNKNIVTIDCNIKVDDHITFQIRTENGEQIKTEAIINEEFIENNGIKIQNLEPESRNSCLIKIDYFQPEIGNFTYQYKVGSNGSWKTYSEPVEITDIYLFQNDTAVDNDKFTFYARSYNESGSQVIMSKEYECEVIGYDLIPKLYSNTGSNGYVSGATMISTSTGQTSGNNYNHIYYAFDRNYGTYVTYGYDGLSGGWIQYTFNEMYYITGFVSTVWATGKTYTYYLQVYDCDSEQWVNIKSANIGSGSSTSRTAQFCYHSDKIRLYTPTYKGHNNNFAVYELQVKGLTDEQYADRNN